MAWQDAIEGSQEGVRLQVETTPGARRAAFPDGYNPWRRRLQARVQAPAQDGKANAELLRSVADVLGVPSDRVAIVAGATDRRKTVRVDGIGRDEAIARLAPHF